MQKLTREQIALSTLIGDGLLDKTPTRSIAERADLIVRKMLQEPDVVRRALDSSTIHVQVHQGDPRSEGFAAGVAAGYEEGRRRPRA